MIDRNGPPKVRDLVLIGGGHAHIQVLRAFGMQPEPGVRLTLISPSVESPYSGMLPGCVAGEYQDHELHIDLVNLTRFAGARLILSEVCGLAPESRVIELSDRPPMRYDLLSVNCGATPASDLTQATLVKPISRFLPKWHAFAQTAQAGQSVSVVGAGAGGVELAFAIRQRLPEVKIHLIGPRLLRGRPGVSRRLQQEFERSKIHWHADRVVDEHAGQLQLASGQTLAHDHVFWVTGVRALSWQQSSGLDTDELGFIRVDKHLRSTSHNEVFAAGDCAHLYGQEREKSGVYAVREGPFLAANLRRAIRAQPLRRYRAQRRHLALLGLGQQRALAVRGGWYSQGRIWWWLKQKIDRRFMRRFNELPHMSPTAYQLPAALAADLPEQEMRCGGCGAKVAAEPLRRVLDRLSIKAHPLVRRGIGDDAAEVVVASGSQLLTVDGFRAMIDDPYLFGRIAAHHSLNDIFAMGGKPTAALALITVPLMAQAMIEDDLFQLLSGVVAVLDDHQVALVGGHTAEGAELSVGLTISGEADDVSLAKTTVKVGQRLILSKPLGTGVVLAAAMQTRIVPDDLAEVLAGMDQSNAAAMRVMLDVGAAALTDITGFGLLGHVGEMLRPQGLGVDLRVADIPFYRGIRMFSAVQSSLQSANELNLLDYELKSGLRLDDVRVKALMDPQTSGGLLAAIEPAQVQACLTQLAALGYQAAEIGEITAAGFVLR